MNKTIETKVNGVDVAQLNENIEVMKSDPELAQFEFRADNTWVDGSINKSTFKGFYGAKEEDTTRTQEFEYTNDEPISLLGTDKAVNPAEYLLHALAGCLTTTIAYHAAARGITIYKMKSKAKGKLDLQGLLGIDPKVRPGFQDIEIGFNIQSDADEEELKEIIQHSVIFDTVQNTVPVTVKINQ